MTNLTDVARAALLEAQRNIGLALAALPLAAPTLARVSTPAALDAALAAAKPNDIIVLDLALRYPAALELRQPVTLQAEMIPGGRMTRAAALPQFLGGLTVTADHVTLAGLEVRHADPLRTLVTLHGAHVLLDRCRVLGDPVQGGKRGIEANGGDMILSGCYVADLRRPALETQAVCAWDMGPGLLIDNCYLAGGSQAVLLGGADAPDARTPRAVTIQNSTLTKDPRWYAEGAQIKCALEVKNAIGVTVRDCVLEYAGTSEGQDAYLIVATVRNQDGAAPWATIRDVIITNCTGGHAGGLLNLLGTDNVHPSGPLDGLTLTGCRFTDLDPTGLSGGHGRLLQFQSGPTRVAIRDTTVQGQHLHSLGYFVGLAPVGLALERLTLPAGSLYGWKIDGGGMGLAALHAYAPDAVLNQIPGA